MFSTLTVYLFIRCATETQVSGIEIEVARRPVPALPRAMSSPTTEARVAAEVQAVTEACRQEAANRGVSVNAAVQAAPFTPNWKLVANMAERACSANLTENPKSFLRLLIAYERHRTAVNDNVLQYEPGEMENFCEEVHLSTRFRMLPLPEREALGVKLMMMKPELAHEAAKYMKGRVMEQIGRNEGLTEEEVFEALMPRRSMDGTTQTGPGSLDGSA